MANYVETMMIGEGPSTFTTHTFLQSDGVTGELTNTPIVAASELNPPFGAGQYMSIWEIWYQLTNFTVMLSWKTLTGTDRIWVMAPSTDSRQKFHRFGGLVDSSGLYAQGQLLMTTTGFTTNASQGSFVLCMHKHDGQFAGYRNIGLPQGLIAGEAFSGSD